MPLESFDEGINGPSEDHDTKEGLMRNMAHLWLKSEVQELERNLSPQSKQRKKRGNFDFANLPFVFVVPDVSALTDFTHVIKQIIKSQKLIVVIPNAVISEMDQLKVKGVASIITFYGAAWCTRKKLIELPHCRYIFPCFPLHN